MDKDTVIEAIFELADKGYHDDDAVVLLQGELEKKYSPDEILNIIRVAEMGGIINDKKKYSECIYELLNGNNHPISHEEKINEYFSICRLISSLNV